MTKNLLVTLFSVIFISCGGPGVVIQYQGSSPIPPVDSIESSEDTQRESGSSRTGRSVIVSSMPALKGGNRTLRKRIDYPEKAIRNGIEGVVAIQFIIDGEGNTTDFAVVEGIGYGCELAVIQAIQNSKFDPGPVNPDTNGRFTWMVTAEFRL